MKNKSSNGKCLSDSAVKRPKTVISIGLLIAIAVGVLAFSGILSLKMKKPWVLSGKNPNEYTWAEFEALTDEQKLAFSQAFEAGAFEIWMENVTESVDKSEEQPNPWKNGGKQPSEYTWKEFEALTDIQKMAFSQSFEAGGFEAWMEQVKEPETEGTEELCPWEQGGKQPGEYTWEEFEALTDDQKIAFSQSFETGGFEAWMERVKEPEATSAETQSQLQVDVEQPGDYTWEEFEALTDEQKLAFSQTFQGNGFEEWMSKAQRAESAEIPWENGGKQPNQYTWPEFVALTPNQQTAFVSWFGTDAEFEAWMDSVKGE